MQKLYKIRPVQATFRCLIRMRNLKVSFRGSFSIKTTKLSSQIKTMKLITIPSSLTKTIILSVNTNLKKSTQILTKRALWLTINFRDLKKARLCPKKTTFINDFIYCSLSLSSNFNQALRFTCFDKNFVLIIISTEESNSPNHFCN
jgi:hypothetical protein